MAPRTPVAGTARARPTLPENWTLRAFCRGHPDPDLWLSSEDGPLGVLRDAHAAALCREQCPVLDACQKMILALEAGQPRGHRHCVYGGLTPRQRVAIDAGDPIPPIRLPRRNPVDR